jgi:hypothetical protein
MLPHKGEGNIIIKEDLIKETEENSIGVKVDHTLEEEEEAP